MQLTIARRLGLCIGFLLVLFIIWGAFSIVMMYQFEARIRDITLIKEPLSAAAYEMEINLIGTGFGLLGYLHDHDPKHLERIKNDQMDFEVFQKQYNQLATTEKERQLGRRIDQGYDRFKKMADHLITLEDTQTQKARLLEKEFKEMNHLLDEKIQKSISSAGFPDSRKLEAVLEMEININEVSAALGKFLKSREAPQKANIYKNADDFQRYFKVYRGLIISPDEKQWAEQMDRLFNESMGHSNEISELEIEKNNSLAEFVKLRRELDQVLDDEIQTLTQIALDSARADIHRSVARTNIFFFILLLTGLFAGGFVGKSTANSIIRPLSKLVAASNRLAKGDFSNRVEIRSNDELRILGESFNRMTEELGNYIEKNRQSKEKLQQAHDEMEKSDEELRELNETLDQRVKERTAQFEEANRAKSIFLANMSHELRTPLNTVMGFTDLLLRDADTGKDTLSSEQRERLSIVLRSGQHLLTLINDVLELSRIEAGRITVRTTPCDLHGLLNGLEDMFDLKTGEKDLTLEFELASDLPRFVTTDEVKLRQVLINLVGNAVKFTENGGVTVRAGVRAPDNASADTAPARLFFEISDTGVGIAPEELDILFDAFAQTQFGRTQQEGTGLGLTISRQFVRMMGGEITVQSRPGKGAMFAFEIPFLIV